ncbi:MAG: GT4 family glycosyltransferase PelF [Saprospiraceae bacterium]|nr:GT4 family glycosyltransferase PelF [Nitrospira sp.]
MAKVRLLELRNTYKWGGGPDKTILLSAEKHDPARVTVVVAYVRDVRDHEFRITQKAGEKGLTYYEIPEKGKLDLSVISALRDIVHRHDINLIHGHDYKSDFFAYLVKLLLRKRKLAVISTAHAWVMLGPRGTFYRWLDLFLMKRFDHLIAVSEATKEEMVSTGVPKSMITMIHNAIDTKAWAPIVADSMTFRKELGIGKEYPVIGYVGRIMPEKDLETWLRAAALVVKQFKEVRFLLIGEGSEGSNTLSQLVELAKELGIADRVIFPGYRSILQPVYAAFDLFVLSSRREGLPNSILEAMAMGLPVVTTDVAGAKELVVNEKTGIVVPQGNVNELAKAMIRILEDKPTRLQMGQAGRMRIENQFAFSKRLECVEDLYENVLRAKGLLHTPESD